jgi:hypothetical protein
VVYAESFFLTRFSFSGAVGTKIVHFINFGASALVVKYSLGAVWQEEELGKAKARLE